MKYIAVQELINGLDELGAQERVQVALEEQLQLLQEKLNSVTHLNTGGGQINKLLHHEVEGKLRELLAAMGSIIKTSLEHWRTCSKERMW